MYTNLEWYQWVPGALFGIVLGFSIQRFRRFRKTTAKMNYQIHMETARIRKTGVWNPWIRKYRSHCGKQGGMNPKCTICCDRVTLLLEK